MKADVEDDLEELELDLLLTGIARRWGYDFRGYSPASLRRRVHRAMANEGVRSLSALQERVLHRPDALQRFISTLSVQVTGMFRDAQVYRALRKHVIPMLRTYPFVRVWHAGCSTGEEQAPPLLGQASGQGPAEASAGAGDEGCGC